MPCPSPRAPSALNDDILALIGRERCLAESVEAFELAFESSPNNNESFIQIARLCDSFRLCEDWMTSRQAPLAIK